LNRNRAPRAVIQVRCVALLHADNGITRFCAHRRYCPTCDIILSRFFSLFVIKRAHTRETINIRVFTRVSARYNYIKRYPFHICSCTRLVRSTQIKPVNGLIYNIKRRYGEFNVNKSKGSVVKGVSSKFTPKLCTAIARN